MLTRRKSRPAQIPEETMTRKKKVPGPNETIPGDVPWNPSVRIKTEKRVRDLSEDEVTADTQRFGRMKHTTKQLEATTTGDKDSQRSAKRIRTKQIETENHVEVHSSDEAAHGNGSTDKILLKAETKSSSLMKRAPRKSTPPEVDTHNLTHAAIVEENIIKVEEGNKFAVEKTEKKVRKKRKTEEEKELEAMPIAERTTGLRMFVGAHVSCAKGVQNSVSNAVYIGGNSLAMFLKSQRKWDNPPLQDDHRDQFKHLCVKHGYDLRSHILPHGSYLVNLAQEETEKADQAFNTFLDDLKRCEALGITLYNFHPGWTGSASRPAAIGRVASALNRAHSATNFVKPVLETMAGTGNVIGSAFEDFRDIIALVDDKSRIGVCIDTCHIFAAGYDLRTRDAFSKTLEKFDSIVGMKYLSALHLNDSKAPFSSHRDLHQNIGLGFLGLRAFHSVMNEQRFANLPLVLETPIGKKSENGKDVEDKAVWSREIKLLESMIAMDPESHEFQTMEKNLADEGAKERSKYEEAFEKKKMKEKKAADKGQTKLSFGKPKRKQLDHSSDMEP